MKNYSSLQELPIKQVKTLTAVNISENATSAENISIIFDTDDIYYSAPHEAFNKYINSADAGSAYAQFIISEILSRCSNAYNSEEVEYECKELKKLIGDSNFRELSEVWLERAAKQGHIIADLLFNISNYKKIGREQTKSKIKHAQTQAINDYYLFGRLSIIILRYYESFIAGSRVAKTKDTDYLAWYLLSCERDIGCDKENFQTVFIDTFSPQLMDEARNKASSFANALYVEDCGKLGLDRERKKRDTN